MKDKDIKIVDTLEKKVKDIIDEKFEVRGIYSPDIYLNSLRVGVVFLDKILVIEKSFMDEAMKIAKKLEIKSIQKNY